MSFSLHFSIYFFPFHTQYFMHVHIFVLVFSCLYIVSFISYTSLKCWINRHQVFVLFVKDLGRDIYDLYAEYEYEEEEDRFPVSPSHLLLSPTKHFTLNINVGGTVTLLSFYHKHTARLDMLKTRLSHFCCDLTEPDCSSQTHSFTISRLKILHQGELFSRWSVLHLPTSTTCRKEKLQQFGPADGDNVDVATYRERKKWLQWF